ncbi:MAG TPA: hypothetical protein VNM37_20545, partial [Candidatus Dormibacteraeota bacterium]|nr:hypothetical protein [Candidatus Dormibacteraeota bacterium]
VKGGLWNVGGTFNFNGGFFVLDYTIAGNTAPVPRWSLLPSANTGTSSAGGIAFDSTGHILISGAFAFGTVDFGGASLSTTLNSRYGFVAEYNK